jgi:hypothetical protein
MLRSAIGGLEHHLDSLETWLHTWVALVVLGVVFELGFVLWDHKEGLEEHYLGTIHSPRKPSVWKLYFQLFSAGLVVIGVDWRTRNRCKSGETANLFAREKRAAKPTPPRHI